MMNYRKLRIAWSVGWGVAAVLLCVLWVRSYRGESSVSVAGHWIVSFYGIIHVDSWVPNPIGEGWADFGNGYDVPYWIPVSVTFVCAFVIFPWIAYFRSFSLGLCS